MHCLRVNVTSPRQISMHILMSLANKLPCILVSLVLTEAVGIINFQLEPIFLLLNWSVNWRGAHVGEH